MSAKGLIRTYTCICSQAPLPSRLAQRHGAANVLSNEQMIGLASECWDTLPMEQGKCYTQCCTTSLWKAGLPVTNILTLLSVYVLLAVGVSEYLKLDAPE